MAPCYNSSGVKRVSFKATVSFINGKICNLFYIYFQGAELSNIVTNSTAEDHSIVKTIRQLEALLKEEEVEKCSNVFQEHCNLLATECCKGWIHIENKITC
jgi:hypothetical protein